ncbi:hypothetical protein GCM10017674_66480 [Streptomyces gardneri]|uniref:Uncharacterized protein n=1 Tax=Streptomyces gardneri TaxID=66892 RepID=A0A4Y3RIB4_9ACTN|nr:hypothetical protein SGA01_27140 [Streptomyces gardneri]GHH16499.1 hypothetical protein GCM10017674_66480 [Streptomyces gardneri]
MAASASGSPAPNGRTTVGPHRNLDRQGAADKKAELVRKMREKARAAEAAAAQASDGTARS